VRERICHQSCRWLACLVVIMALAAVAPQAARASDAADAEALVTKARIALENFRRDPDMAHMRRLAHRAHGVFIMPELLKGGFIVGGSGGRGVLVSRYRLDQPWLGPAFYTVGGISFGLQAGAQVSEVVMLAMTKRGITTMLTSSVKLGADVNVAVGPVGAGAEAATAGISADLLVFSRSKGLYGGLTLQGAVIGARERLNHAFYGAPVSTNDILVTGAAASERANGLLTAVSQLSEEVR
jgi:lipid-binding SYLF domain-containing protein